MTKIIGCIFSYDITKGMKSFGPKGLLKSKKSDELINCQINNILHTTDNICVITGFGSEKLIKRINPLYDIETIHNAEFNNYNEGHALELLLDKYTDDCSGILLLSNGLLLNVKIKDYAKSTIYTVKRTNNNSFNLGCIFDKNVLENIFYDIGTSVWCEAVFLSQKEIDVIQAYRQNTNIKNKFQQ